MKAPLAIDYAGRGPHHVPWSRLAIAALAAALLVGAMFVIAFVAMDNNWLPHDRICPGCGGTVGIALLSVVPAVAFFISLTAVVWVIARRQSTGNILISFLALGITFGETGGGIAFLIAMQA